MWFEEFWKVFNYKLGKAEAADSWYDIQELNLALFEKILDSAEKESKRRRSLIENGRTPKMAQGWLTGRRWDDDIELGGNNGGKRLGKILV